MPQKIKIARTVIDVVAVSGIVVLCALGWLTVHAQDTATEQPVKFALSEVENLKLDNLRLQKQLIQCQLNEANGAYQQDLNQYVSKTLKDHGLPKNVVFDGVNLKWTVTEDKKQDIKK